MRLESLDEALAPWRREREAAAWKRVQELRAEAASLEHQRRKITLGAEAALGALGVASAGEQLSALQSSIARAKAKAAWYLRHKARVRTYLDRRRECSCVAWEGVCQHCGLVHTWARRCGAHVVCASCAKARASRLVRKLTPAIRTNHAREVTKWHAAGRPRGKFPVVTLLTFTMRSTALDDLAERNRLFSAAWNRWRSWYQGRYGKRLSYAWTREITDGRKGQGHVHIHAVCILPFVHFREVSAAWERALDGRAGHVDFSSGSRKDAKSAAWYVAKYASKGVKHLSVQVAAAWVQAQHGRRSVSTSRDWWVPDREQHGPWVLRVVPASVTMSGDATLVAHTERGEHDADEHSARGRPCPDG